MNAKRPIDGIVPFNLQQFYIRKSSPCDRKNLAGHLYRRPIRMEIRCGSCNKLFRVSDDKITGKGIKFACSRCGEYVKITREDFEKYTQSQTVVAALDLSDQNAKSAAALSTGAETVAAGKSVSAPASAVQQSDLLGTRTAGPTPSAMQASTVPDFLQEKDTPPVFEPEPTSFDEQSLPAEVQYGHEPEPMPIKEERLSEPEILVKPGTALEPHPETQEEQKPELQQAPAQKPALDRAFNQEPISSATQEQLASKPEPQFQTASVPRSAPAYQPRPVPKPVGQPRTEPVRQSATGVAAPAGSPVGAKRESARPAAPAPPMTVIGAAAASPARSGMLVILTVIVLLVLVGTGVFFYLRSSLKTENEPISPLTSVEGLHILNASGSIEPDGDLLISGEIENTTDKQKSAWYIIVEVFDANGSVINRLRLVNGKQIFTRNDYEIMTKRGMNVNDVKARTLSEQGVVIPPKGKAAFEVRYLQPPIGVASFNASLHPFDPVRLYREIAEEAK